MGTYCNQDLAEINRKTSQKNHLPIQVIMLEIFWFDILWFYVRFYWLRGLPQPWQFSFFCLGIFLPRQDALYQICRGKTAFYRGIIWHF